MQGAYIVRAPSLTAYAASQSLAIGCRSLGAVTTLSTRREILKGAAVGVGALGVGATLAGPAQAAKRERVAIIGAGAGGIAAAYFLAGTYDVEVFEARSRIGGHCDSRTIDYKGHPVTVDLGAQFFHPDTHPLYVTLLEELGLYDPANPDSRKTHVAQGSLCVFPMRRRPAAVHVDPSARHASQRARFRQLHAARAASGPRRAGLGDHRR